MIPNTRTTLLAAALSGLSLLAGCGASTAPDDGTGTAADGQRSQPESQTIAKAMEEARAEVQRELNEDNISISDNGSPAKKAEITPKGDLLIDGRAVAVNAQQRALLLEYRGHVAEVASAGAAVGIEAASLASKAVTESLKGVFSGNIDQIEPRVEASTGKIKQAAQQLCDRLPAMMASQQQLAKALPEFAPYATMTQDDIDDCFDETLEDARQPAAEAAQASAADPAPTH